MDVLKIVFIVENSIFFGRLVDGSMFEFSIVGESFLVFFKKMEGFESCEVVWG